MANVEALTSEEDVNYRYPERSGKALFCKLYVYMSGGVVVSSGTSSDVSTSSRFSSVEPYSK